MPGVRGRTNNPNGRPPSGRALTEILKRTLGHRVELDGKKISGKRVLARMVVNLLLTGDATFPGGKKLEISGRDWVELTKWLYGHIDGSKQEITGADNSPLFPSSNIVRVVIHDDNST